MQCEDKVETEHSLAKVHKVCRLIGIIVKIIFVVFCVCWLSTVLLMIYSLINPSELGAAEGVSVPRIALYFVHGFAVALIFVVFIVLIFPTFSLLFLSILDSICVFPLYSYLKIIIYLLFMPLSMLSFLGILD